jgi:spore maturation protein CgeB
MDILRIKNALRNRVGQMINSIFPPKAETYRGVENYPINLIFCGSRWEYKSRFTGDGYEYTKFIPALKKMAGTVHFIPLEAKNAIVKTIKSFKNNDKMNVVFSVFQRHRDIPSDYFKLSKDGFYLLNWYTDDDMFFDVFSKYVACNFSLNVTTYEPNLPLYAKLGANAVASQWAGIYGCEFNESRKYAACFIGRMYGQRGTLVKKLKEEFGRHIFIHDTRVRHMTETEMISAYQNSWLAIDEPTAFDCRTQQIKARVFENASMGCLVLTKPNSRLSNYFAPGSEILFWETVPALIEIIRGCINNPDDYKKRARSAYERIYKEHLYEHLYEHRFQTIFEYLKKAGEPIR